MAKPLTNKFQCEFCFKEISRKNNLNEHIKKIHQEQQLVILCEICEKTFANNQYLRIHFKCVHEEQKNFKCESCKKKFNRKSHLMVHIQGVILRISYTC